MAQRARVQTTRSSPRPHRQFRKQPFKLTKSLQDLVKRETRFTSKCPAQEIVSKIESTAKPLGFNVEKKNYKVVI